MLRIGQVETSATADGKYTDGSVAGGIAATRLRAAAFNAIQEELANIVESAGMTLSPDDMTQVLAALKKQFLSRTHPFADIKADGAAAIAEALSNLGLKEAAPGVSVVGDSRNARMSITSASATASFTSDMLIVAESLSGKQYRLTSVSKTINLATTGAGGMDTGTAPVSGFVGLYVIYNPTTGDTAMLAVNATSAAVPEIYGGANLPAGYTASALVAVIGTTASALFVIGQLVGRTFSIVNGSAMSTSTSVTGWTSASLATFVPRNGKTVRGTFSVSAQAGQNAIVTGVAATSTGVGAVYAGSIVSSLLQYVMDLATPQTAFYWGQVSGGSISALLTVCAYTI